MALPSASACGVVRGFPTPRPVPCARVFLSLRQAQWRQVNMPPAPVSARWTGARGATAAGGGGGGAARRARAQRRAHQVRRGAVRCAAGDGDSAGDGAEGEGNDEGNRLSDADFEDLAARVAKLRAREVTADQALAHNWRKGRCSHTLFCVLDEYVRKMRMVGDTVACGTHTGTCYLLDRASGEKLRVLEGLEEEVTALDYDGTWLAAGGARGQVWLWNCTEAGNEGTLVCEHAGKRCMAVQLVGDGTVRSASLAGQVCSSSSAGSAVEFTAPGELGCLVTAGGYAIAGLANGGVVVWSTRNFQPILSFSAHEAPILALQMLRDEELDQDVLVTGAADGSIKSWDFNQGKALRTFAGHMGPVACLQFDSSKLVSGARDGSVRVWNLRSGESLYGLYGYTAYISALQFDDNILISDGTNNVLGYHDFSSKGDVGLEDDLDC